MLSARSFRAQATFSLEADQFVPCNAHRLLEKHRHRIGKSAMEIRSLLTWVVTMLCLAYFTTVHGASINVVNKCSYSVTAFARGLNYPQRTIGALSTGQSQVLDVGASFISGLIWGSPHGDTDPSHATQLEFNIGSAGQPPRDYYDISLVNAYNIPALINPTTIAGGEAHTAGTTCGTPICKAYDLPTWCTSPNYIGQADNACINVDGGVSPPTNNPSDGTRQFKTKCPDAISYPPDTTGTVYNCGTGSNYEVVFCP